MAREIDTSDIDNLPAADLLYLHERGQLDRLLIANGDSPLTADQYEMLKAAVDEDEDDELIIIDDDDDKSDKSSDAIAEPGPEYEMQSNATLRKLCSEQGLDKTGNKADLVARLIAHDDASKSEG